MRCIMIVCVIFFVTPLLAVNAEDLQVYDNYLPRYGDYYRSQDGTLQQHEDYTPQFGNYLKREDGKLQEHENYVPNYGDYYKRDGSRWQKYEDYVPDYGKYLEARLTFFLTINNKTKGSDLHILHNHSDLIESKMANQKKLILLIRLWPVP